MQCNAMQCNAMQCNAMLPSGATAFVYTKEYFAFQYQFKNLQPCSGFEAVYGRRGWDRLGGREADGEVRKPLLSKRRPNRARVLGLGQQPSIGGREAPPPLCVSTFKGQGSNMVLCALWLRYT